MRGETNLTAEIEGKYASRVRCALVYLHVCMKYAMIRRIYLTPAGATISVGLGWVGIFGVDMAWAMRYRDTIPIGLFFGER